jgi:curli production assembly/transport component CsgF
MVTNAEPAFIELWYLFILFLNLSVMTRALLIGCCLLASVAVQGQTLIYRPVNPSFGGNTFNYSWMLSSAQAQDKIKDPNPSSSTTGGSSRAADVNSLTSFSQSLQSQLLNQLSRNLFTQQFGESGLKEGTFQFGDLQVIITNGLDGVNIQITDGKGGQTTITVPYY